MNEEQQTQLPKIGDRVKATMNGENWFEGVFEEESEIFASYGVRVDGLDRVKFFIHAELA